MKIKVETAVKVRVLECHKGSVVVEVEGQQRPIALRQGDILTVTANLDLDGAGGGA